MKQHSALRQPGPSILVLVALCLAAALPAWPAAAAPAPQAGMVFIVDASGSMWAKLGDKTRIEIAKQVLGGLIRDLPADVDVGLVAYGHRTKGDCNDVEELVPLGAANKTDLIARINALNPKGMTPIAASVRATVEKLRPREQETTILLVSDGEETCHADPCALVGELKASGIRFVLHVIGFAVGAKEQAQLECLAEAGGGSYFSAANAGEFLAATRKVAESVTIGAEPGQLTLPKNVYQPLEKIVVRFEARPDYAEGAWVGLIPSAVPHTESESDEHDIAYEYIKKRTTGEMTFAAPRVPGSYDLRMFNGDVNGKEVASTTFEVQGDLGAGTLGLEKSVFAPGEPVPVRFTAGERFSPRAWVGLFETGVPHAPSGPSDSHDISFEYLSERTSGVLTFRAPYEKGSYDLRLFDTAEADGQEVASVTFKVEGEVAAGTLTLDKSTYLPGEKIRVAFQAAPGYQASAWVGLIPSEVAHGSAAEADQHDIAYEDILERLEGAMEFRAPVEPGLYDVRMFDASGDARETASASFTVAGEMEKGTIRLDKPSYAPKEKIGVTFTASANYQSNAWIGLIPASVEHGSEEVNDRHDIAYQYLRGKTSGSFQFTAPENPGTYDFRMNNAGQEVASTTFTVN